MSIRDLAGEQWAQAGFGLAIGTLARYALRIQDRLPIGWREIVADVMLLGINAVLTMFAIDRLGATGKGAVLTAALFGIAQDRVIRVLRRRMEKRAAALEAALFGEEPDKADPSPPTPSSVPRAALPKPFSAAEQKPADVGEHLRRAFRQPLRTPPPDDQIEALRHLDQEPDV